MKDLAIYAAFKANQDYLAENVCLNRFTPEELCFAACVLTATIQDSQENQQFPSTLLENYQLVLCPLAFDKATSKIRYNKLQQVPMSEVYWTSTSFLNDIFQPPEV